MASHLGMRIAASVLRLMRRTYVIHRCAMVLPFDPELPAPAADADHGVARTGQQPRCAATRDRRCRRGAVRPMTFGSGGRLKGMPAATTSIRARRGPLRSDAPV